MAAVLLGTKVSELKETEAATEPVTFLDFFVGDCLKFMTQRQFEGNRI